MDPDNDPIDDPIEPAESGETFRPAFVIQDESGQHAPIPEISGAEPIIGQQFSAIAPPEPESHEMSGSEHEPNTSSQTKSKIHHAVQHLEDDTNSFDSVIAQASPNTKPLLLPSPFSSEGWETMSESSVSCDSNNNDEFNDHIRDFYGDFALAGPSGLSLQFPRADQLRIGLKENVPSSSREEGSSLVGTVLKQGQNPRFVGFMPIMKVQKLSSGASSISTIFDSTEATNPSPDGSNDSTDHLTKTLEQSVRGIKISDQPEQEKVKENKFSEQMDDQSSSAFLFTATKPKNNQSPPQSTQKTESNIRSNPKEIKRIVPQRIGQCKYKSAFTYASLPSTSCGFPSPTSSILQSPTSSILQSPSSSILQSPTSSVLQSPTSSILQSPTSSSLQSPISSIQLPTSSISQSPVSSSLQSPTLLGIQPPMSFSFQPPMTSTLQSSPSTTLKSPKSSSLQSPTSSSFLSPTSSPCQHRTYVSSMSSKSADDIENITHTMDTHDLSESEKSATIFEEFSPTKSGTVKRKLAANDGPEIKVAHTEKATTKSPRNISKAKAHRRSRSEEKECTSQTSKIEKIQNATQLRRDRYLARRRSIEGNYEMFTSQLSSSDSTEEDSNQ